MKNKLHKLGFGTSKAMALLAGAALLAALLVACGGGASANSTTAAAGYDTAYAPMAEPAAASEEIGWGGADYGMDGGEGTGLLADPSRKIIYNAHLRLETTEYDSARAELLSAAAAAGGYVESSSQYGNAEDGNRWIDLTLRIPSRNYNSFLEAAENAASLLNKDESTQDITSQYVDVEARLSSLKNQEQRLQELAAQAESLEDLLAIEERLSDVQYMIESYTAQQRLYDNQVDYSTVTVELNEVRVYTPVKRGFGSRIVNAFQSSWRDFGEELQDFAVGFVYALPTLLVLGLLAAAVFVIVRRGAKKAAERRANRPRPSKPDPGYPAQNGGPAPGTGEDGPTQPPKYEYKP